MKATDRQMTHLHHMLTFLLVFLLREKWGLGQEDHSEVSPYPTLVPFLFPDPAPGTVTFQGSKTVGLAALLCVGTLRPIFILSLNSCFPAHCSSEIKGYRVVIRNKGVRLIAAWHTYYYWICVCLAEVLSVCSCLCLGSPLMCLFQLGERLTVRVLDGPWVCLL